MVDNSKKKKEEPVEEGLPIWMATFADMMTLLFAFFVLLFSMSTIDPVKVSAMEDAMNENAVQNAAGTAANTSQGNSQPRLSISEIKDTLEDIFYHLQEKSDAKYMFLISIKDINAGDELTANYNLYTYPKTGIGVQTF